ncbi:hypothetical protein [Streptomyces sp. NPDC088812]|uniref:hypothetical protein n=1 Tax=Streptomyces sp. NPDC088812 TaxID=3365905 RepID=UPI0037FEEBF8
MLSPVGRRTRPSRRAEPVRPEHGRPGPTALPRYREPARPLTALVDFGTCFEPVTRRQYAGSWRGSCATGPATDWPLRRTRPTKPRSARRYNRLPERLLGFVGLDQSDYYAWQQGGSRASVERAASRTARGAEA